MHTHIYTKYIMQCVYLSVKFSRSVVSDSLWPHESQHARPPCPSQTPRVYSNSHPLSQWCHPAISSSVIPFSSCPQSLPASGSFQMNQLFAWGGQSIGVSASASVLPINTQDLSPSGWTGWISLQSKWLSRVFSNTTVQKHQFFSAQLSSQSNSQHTCMHIDMYYIQNVTTSDLLCYYLQPKTTSIPVFPSSSHASLESSLVARIIFKTEARLPLSLAHNQ